MIFCNLDSACEELVIIIESKELNHDGKGIMCRKNQVFKVT